MNHRILSLASVIACALTPLYASAVDTIVQPPSGNGFVVKDASGANERLRVQESGAVSMPAVPSAPAQSQGLCMSEVGQLGPCRVGARGYSAGTGLVLSGTTFSVAPSYRLPQGCMANQIAKWSGTEWVCGTMSAGATLPIGTVNQTLRYDASNTLVANTRLQTFTEGGVVASGALGVGSIPVEGGGTRLMWYPGKAAFRAGSAFSNEWDNANVGVYSAAMGDSTSATGAAATAMGRGAYAIGNSSTAMGYRTTAEGVSSTAIGESAAAVGIASVAMGFRSVAVGKASTALGNETVASGVYSTAMGQTTKASGSTSVAMGASTTASGEGSTAMGVNTIASGNYSTAMGVGVSTASHVGSFIYGDNSNPANPAQNTADNQFLVAASGGVYFFTNPTRTTGAGLSPGNGSWTNLSDRNAKTSVQPVDSREVLKKVASLPLNTWQYKAQDAKYRHMGPMAQDFYAAFQLGESDKGIDTVDADGVALAAIQGLHAELTEKDREIAALRLEMTSSRSKMTAQAKNKDAQIAALQARVASLESVAADMADMKVQVAALRRSVAIPVAVVQQP